MKPSPIQRNNTRRGGGERERKEEYIREGVIKRGFSLFFFVSGRRIRTLDLRVPLGIWVLSYRKEKDRGKCRNSGKRPKEEN